MTEFFKGDIVRVEMPRGYTGRGLLSISLMFSTYAEAKFEGAVGTITEINPVGPHTVHQYLVDFKTHDNSRIGIPWQAQWFREEWLELVEKASKMTVAAGGAPESTWPERPAPATAPLTIAHPEAKLFTEGRRDFAPGSPEEERAPGIAHPEAKIFREGRVDFAPGSSSAETSLGYTGPEGARDRSGANMPTYEPTPETMHGVIDATTPTNAPGTAEEVSPAVAASLVPGQTDGFVRLSGTSECPEGFPIKGNANSGIFHAPTDSTYQRTTPEICFATEEVARLHGFRPPARRGQG